MTDRTSPSRVSAPTLISRIQQKDLIRIGRSKRLATYFLFGWGMFLRSLSWARPQNSRKVLVLEPFGLGDMITFEPLIRELSAAGFHVIPCSKPEWQPLLPDPLRQHWFNLRLPWATHNEKSKYRLSHYFSSSFRRELQQLRNLAAGAIGIDARGDIRSVLYLYLAGCSRVISLSNYLGSDLKMWRTVAELVPFRNDLRRWELNLLFLKKLVPAHPLKGVPSPRLQHLIHRPNPQRVALIPIAPWKGKLWPPERWQQVASWLQARHLNPLALCGPNQASAARQAVGPSVEVTECASIQSWADAFNKCTFAITVDSGPMHLADALDLPVIALFGQGKLPLWAPSGPSSIVLSHQDDPDFYVCHPVDENTHLGQKFMNRITVQEVTHAVESLLQKKSTSATAPSSSRS